MVLPEWKIETNTNVDDDEGVQQLSFSSSSQIQTEPKRAKTPVPTTGPERKTETLKSATAEETDRAPGSNKKLNSKPKSIWSLR